MGNDQDLRLSLRRQQLAYAGGYAAWEVEHTPCAWPAAQTALVLCDVWDRHTCRGAEQRLEQLLPRMNEVVRVLRQKGALVVHAPSDTMPFYEGASARQRALQAARVQPPPNLDHDDPPLPVDASDGGCDTLPDEAHPRHERGMPYPWTRQHPAIEIDQERDAISARGQEHYNLYRERGITHVLIMGVHTNMCILNRTFAIKQMVRWGLDVALVRDLTDAMYNPARPPYVSHEAGTRLIIEYIEKFWCPSVASDELLAA